MLAEIFEDGGALYALRVCPTVFTANFGQEIYSFIFICGEASRSMDHDSLPINHLMEAFRPQESMAVQVIEATGFNSETVCDL